MSLPGSNRHAQELLSTSRREAEQSRGAFGIEATEADLARIDVPTLLVAGEGSPPAFRRVTERMAAAIPDSRTMLVGGGHFIDPGEPDVLKFVSQVLGR
jgi:pimeloyl-ACP methyl ester carboxylesterase